MENDSSVLASYEMLAMDNIDAESKENTAAAESTTEVKEKLFNLLSVLSKNEPNLAEVCQQFKVTVERLSKNS